MGETSRNNEPVNTKSDLNPKLKERRVAWETQRGSKTIKEIILNFVNSKNYSTQYFESLLSVVCRPQVQTLLGLEEENYKFKLFDRFIIINAYIVLSLMALDMSFLENPIVDLVVKGYYWIGIAFTVYHHSIYTFNRDEIHTLYLWTQALHNPENKLVQQLLSFNPQHPNKFNSSLNWSVLYTKFTKISVFLFLFLAYVVLPIIKTLISRDVQDLKPAPLRIIFVDNDRIVVVAFVVFMGIWILFFIGQLFIASQSLVFMILVRVYYFADVVQDYVRYNKQADVKGKQEWIKDLIEATNQLSE